MIFFILFSLLVSSAKLAQIKEKSENFYTEPKSIEMVSVLDWVSGFSYEDYNFMLGRGFSDEITEKICGDMNKLVKDIENENNQLISEIDENSYENQENISPSDMSVISKPDFGFFDVEYEEEEEIVEVLEECVEEIKEIDPKLLPAFHPSYPRFKSSSNTSTFLLLDLNIDLESIPYIRNLSKNKQIL